MNGDPTQKRLRGRGRVAPAHSDPGSPPPPRDEGTPSVVSDLRLSATGDQSEGEHSRQVVGEEEHEVGGLTLQQFLGSFIAAALRGSGPASTTTKPATSRQFRSDLPSLRFRDRSDSQVLVPAVSGSGIEAAGNSVQLHGDRAHDDELHDETRCAICMSDFVDGDEITTLPCGHCFHRGVEQEPTQGSTTARASQRSVRGSPRSTRSQDTAIALVSECPGVLAWLKQNNECPLCRKQLPAERPAAEARQSLGDIFGGGDIIARGVHLTFGNGAMQAPPFFFTGIPLQGFGQGVADIPGLGLPSLGSVDQFQFEVPLGAFPLGAFGLMGDLTMSSGPPSRSGRARHEQPSRQIGSRIRPSGVHLPAIDYSQSWQCPGCLTSNVGNVQMGSIGACSCGVRRRVLLLSESIALPVFTEAISIFLAARQSIEGETTSSSSNDQGETKVGSKRRAPSRSSRLSSLESNTAQLRRRIELLVNGSGMNELESSGWRVRHVIDVLLHAALKVQTTAAIRIFLTHRSDANSNALLNVLVNSIRRALPAQKLELVHFFNKFSPSVAVSNPATSTATAIDPEPIFNSVNSSKMQDSSDGVRSNPAVLTSLPVQTATTEYSPCAIVSATVTDLPKINNRCHNVSLCVSEMIDSTTGDILCYGQRLAFGVTEVTWQNNMMKDLENFAQRGWELTAGFSHLRRGERSIEVVASGVDNNSAAVLEALLGIVTRFESSFVN